MNCKGISVLNDVESAASVGNHVKKRGRLIPMPACLQWITCTLEKEGEHLRPLDFGEGLEFDYAHTTRLVIDAFGLTNVRKERPINISASIDAAKFYQKYYAHLSRTEDHRCSG